MTMRTVIAVALILGGCEPAPIYIPAGVTNADALECQMQGQMAAAASDSPQSIGLVSAATGATVMNTCLQMKAAQRAERTAQPAAPWSSEPASGGDAETARYWREQRARYFQEQREVPADVPTGPDAATIARYNAHTALSPVQCNKFDTAEGCAARQNAAVGR